MKSNGSTQKILKKTTLVCILILVIFSSAGAFVSYKYKQSYDLAHRYDGKILVYMDLGSSSKEINSMFNKLIEKNILKEVSYSSQDNEYEKYSGQFLSSEEAYSCFICSPKTNKNYDDVYEELKKLEPSECFKVVRGGTST